MGEGEEGDAKKEALLPAPPDLGDVAKKFVERGIPGDSINNVMGVKNWLNMKQYDEVKKVGTYADYMRVKFRGFVPEVAEAIINASDPVLVERYNKKVDEINAEIGDGVKDDTQADRVKAKINELSDIIYGRA